jgi:hypothetical protein
MLHLGLFACFLRISIIQEQSREMVTSPVTVQVFIFNLAMSHVRGLNASSTTNIHNFNKIMLHIVTLSNLVAESDNDTQ